MDKYLESYREIISLRGLTGHTLKGYSTYIRAYLDYLQHVLCKLPENVSWQEMRDFIHWLQKERSLSDRTINCAISQLRFFTLYVLHKLWDDTQPPWRRFDEYLRYEDVSRTRMRLFIRHGKNRQSRYALLSKAALDILTLYWRSCGRTTG